MMFSRTDTPRAFSRALAIAMGTFGFFMLALLLTRAGAPRYLLLPVFVAVLALAPLAVVPRTVQIVGIAVLGVALLGEAVLAGRVALTPLKKAASVITTNAKTAFYALRVRSHKGAVQFRRPAAADPIGSGSASCSAPATVASMRYASRATISRLMSFAAARTGEP